MLQDRGCLHHQFHYSLLLFVSFHSTMPLSVCPSVSLHPELAIRLSATYSCCIELGGALNVEGVTVVAHNRLVQKRSTEDG
jgi:nitrate reductase gamma subunit